jgi:flagellar basal-body rod modification protein FlgD
MSIANPTVKPTDIQSLFPQATPATAVKKQLGQSDFLKLMLTQFKNQDPTKPVDSAQYVAQLAQFSQVQGLADLNSSFKTLSDSVTSNQALQASSLLGRDVLVPGSAATLPQPGTLSGAVDLAQSSSRVLVNIIDGGGAIVRQINLGAHGKGLADFQWDGRNTDGTQAAAGVYTMQAQSVDGNGVASAASTLINATVQSVTMGAGQSGLTLTLQGLGDTPFTNVRRIG